jgi:hypothetical protein
MKSRAFVICFMFFISHNMVSQTFISVTGRSSLIVVPEVDGAEDKLPIGFGGAIRFDWLNKWKRDRCLEFSYDHFTLKEEQTKANYNVAFNSLSLFSYDLHVISASYGFRSYLSSKDEGLYLAGMLGLIITDVEGSTDKTLNNIIGLSGQVTPTIGFTKYGIDVGFQGHVAPGRGSVLVWPTAYLGLRFSATGKRTVEEKK